jgi:hypothetical protein
MNSAATSATLLLLGWMMGVAILALVFPRHRKKVVVSAIVAPLGILMAVSMIRGNSSRSGWIARPPGLTQAEARSRLDEVFSEQNLGCLIVRGKLSSVLTAREAMAHLEWSDPRNDWDTFHWSLYSGSTWRWKANAYRQLAADLSNDIETRLEGKTRPQ